MWKPVVGFEGFYEVSAAGNVRSVQFRRPRRCRQHRNRRGHRRVMLYRPGRRLHAYVHTLVARAFLGPRPRGLLVCHHNDRKADNRSANLYYGTRQDNARDARRNGCCRCWRAA